MSSNVVVLPRRKTIDAASGKQNSTGRSIPAHRRVPEFKARPPHLPEPPTEEEKYSYLGMQRRWPFVWLAAGQGCLIYAFIAVMAHTPDTALGLVFLTVMVPPVVVNLWLRVRRRRMDLGEHLDLILAWRRGRTQWPSVDVFLPTCGEHPIVLRNTFEYVSQLAWPGRLKIHVLDDADDAATAGLAHEMGFHYAVRQNRGEWKKAGNLISAFDRTDGDFIAVFDADFAPRADFLYETIPYMQQDDIGVVQTAQYFDVDNRVNYFARFAGSLQELFFRWIQPARDTCDAAICAGTNVVYRRAAVVAAGGFARVPLGEDVHSGVKLWTANYRTRYLPLAVAKGLAPDSWKALTNQQYRWCRSSMLLMISAFFRAAPFNAKQRVCFWAAFLYYMSSALLPLTSMLPTLIIVWFYPYTIQPGDYMLMIPSIVSTLVIFPMLARGWRPTMYRVATINSFCHAFAVFDALRNKVQAWVPTGATETDVVATVKKSDVPGRIAMAFRVWLVAMQALLWGGVASYLVRNDVSPWLLWPTITLAAYQLVMLAPLAWTLGPKGDVYDTVDDVNPAAGDNRSPQLVLA